MNQRSLTEPPKEPNGVCFRGYIQTTHEALILMEKCRRKELPKAMRRLNPRERHHLGSGQCFIFDEQESGIKRWTDGKIWSPSRILGNFLVYREVERKEPPSKSETSSPSIDSGKSSLTKNDYDLPSKPFHSQKGTYFFKPNGLIKKTISASYQGNMFHLISYYQPSDIPALSRPLTAFPYEEVPKDWLEDSSVFRKHTEWQEGRIVVEEEEPEVSPNSQPGTSQPQKLSSSLLEALAYCMDNDQQSQKRKREEEDMPEFKTIRRHSYSEGSQLPSSLSSLSLPPISSLHVNTRGQTFPFQNTSTYLLKDPIDFSSSTLPPLKISLDESFSRTTTNSSVTAPKTT